MYHVCIFCSAHLKANDALERFPVGRSIAFDAVKGRLWAVCPRCARWNLAPIEERWEAIEDAERIFRDTRTRVQSENIGLARLRDGTRLVRVGQALAGELAAWRYGRTLAQRRRRVQMASGAGGLAVAAAGLLAGGLAAGPLMIAMSVWGGGCITLVAGAEVAHLVGEIRGANRVVHRARVRYLSRDVLVRVLGQHLNSVRLQPDAENREIALHVPAIWGGYGAERFGYDALDPIVLRGNDAARVLGHAMVRLNRRGAKPREVDQALADIENAGSPRDLLLQVARRRQLLNGVEVPDWVEPPYDSRYTGIPADTRTTLALEMALHEETERRALDGELAALQEMWRQAEEIAAIADRLPDGVPAPEPPRLHPPR
jgi:hypothetical protein